MKDKSVNKLINTLLLVITLFSLTNVIAQEKSKKQLKAEAELENQKKIALLVDSKEFVFIARSVLPQGGRMINLTDYYAVEYRLEIIKSELPFFGVGYSGVGYGGENGMQFEGEPKYFNIEKTKDAYSIKSEVKTDHDTYSLFLSVYFDGSARLFISSNNRTSISYNGKIDALKKK
ncbi:MAG TPA: DUF4251 domain-containing protein [Flavobacterium sp.]